MFFENIHRVVLSPGRNARRKLGTLLLKEGGRVQEMALFVDNERG